MKNNILEKGYYNNFPIRLIKEKETYSVILCNGISWRYINNAKKVSYTTAKTVFDLKTMNTLNKIGA